MNKLLTILFLVFINLHAISQEFKFEKVALSDTLAVRIAMKNLAESYLNYAKIDNIKLESRVRFRIEMLAGYYETSIESIEAIRETSNFGKGHPVFIQYELFAKAKIRQISSGEDFIESYRSVFRNYLVNCNDTNASTIAINFTTYDAVGQFTNSFKSNYKNASDTSVPLNEALELLKSYFLFHIYTLTEPVVFEETERDEKIRYLINEKLVISPRDGAELSVITVRKRNKEPLPAILIFTIYAENSNKNQAIIAASKGYVGVIATSRGKRQSKNSIEPYMHEYKDVYAVIDWISQQTWNNGKVGMYGGSYNGFSQWASMKEKVHPVLKTIVPSVSAAPGIDVPMENNIFHNFSYKWVPFVTNNKFLDNTANFDRDRWNNLQYTWFNSGASYNKMDSIDQTPSPLFQEWISHPSYDTYWQNMIPYKDEFSHINIPILSTTGYYDDGQPGAMYYYLEHLKYNPKAEHYLLIGPYDHWGAQSMPSSNLRGYQIDEVAHIDIQNDLVFEWFDYILKGKEKPSILKNKVNFQVMGTNKWIHKSSLSEMNKDTLTFYLSTYKINEHYTLMTEKPKESGNSKLTVDFADRSIMNNSDYYPWPIIKDSINLNDGLVYISEPLQKEKIINGSFTGKLTLESNKNDFDFSVNLYELTPEGKYFHLSYYIGRASYSKSKEYRELLTPNKATTITFDKTRIVSKRISKNSKIVIIINVNKNAFSQINYGTGKDVSKESIIDATIPLELTVDSQSKIALPLWFEK